MDAFAALVDRQPATDTVTFAADSGDAQRLAKARQTLDTAKARVQIARDDTARAEATVAVDDAQAVFDELRADMATITFELRGIGPEVIEEMMAAHPPSAAEKKKARAANGGKPSPANWSEATFPPALLAACCTRIVHSSPDVDDTTDVDVGRATALWSSPSLTVSDKAALFLACLSLDQRDSKVGGLGED